MNIERITLPSASKLLVGGGGCIVAYSVRDTTVSSGSVFQLYDGNDTTGQLILDISTTAAQSTRDFPAIHVVTFTGGLYYNLVSGTIEGVVNVACDHNCFEYWMRVAQSGWS